MIAEVVAPGITRLSTSMGPRRLACYVLDDGEACTIFDAALPGTIVEWIDTGACVKPVTRLVISHADADHVGDAAGLRMRFPQIDVQCHPLDRRWIEDHDLLVAERYGEARARFGFRGADEKPHSPNPSPKERGLDFLAVTRSLRASVEGPERQNERGAQDGQGDQDELGASSALRAMCGANVGVNTLADDGDQLVIGARRWEVLHVPGHTLGHIALWDALGGVLLFGDAVLGFAIPDIDGRPSMPATHRYIAEYLATIDRLMRMPVRLALSAHWPALDGAAFRELLEHSRACVERDLATIVSAYGGGAAGPLTPALSPQAGRGGGRALAEIVGVLNERHRLWPASEDGHYAFAAMGYVEYLAERGELPAHHVRARRTGS
jgi:glyoxylase-like metal-dependent hydrolase (beta-lactamase superfamily II)